MSGTACMTVTAVRLTDGKTVAFDRLVSAEVTASLSSPAQGFCCTAAVDAFPGELGAVTVRLGPRTLFTGQIDRQTASLSAGGRLLTLEARSKGALLLDNEAVPCALTGAQLSTVFGIFAAPYGFVLYNPNGSRSLALYTVHKGQSEWEALIGFTRRAYGRTPYVTGDQIMVDRPRSASPLVIGGAGPAYTRLEYIRAPYHMLSKVVLRDAEGLYSAAVHNSTAAYYGVRRKRYVIPPSEFTDSGALDANQRIRRSMLQVETARVTLPGIVEVPIGREVHVDGDLRLRNLMAGEVAWRQDKSGVTTALELISTVYWD